MALIAERSGVALSTLVTVGIGPVYAGLLGWAFLRHRPTRAWALATVVAVVGAAHVPGMTVQLDKEIDRDALAPNLDKIVEALLGDLPGLDYTLVDIATPEGRKLAERAHVSKPTVVRFCRSVGYDGLADFKLKLAGTVNEGVPFVHRSVDEDDKPGDLIV